MSELEIKGNLSDVIRETGKRYHDDLSIPIIYEAMAQKAKALEKQVEELEHKISWMNVDSNRLLVKNKALEKQVEEAKTNPKDFYYANSAKKMTKLENRVEELKAGIRFMLPLFSCHANESILKAKNLLND